MSTKNIVRVAERVIPARDISIVEIGISQGSVGVSFDDGTVVHLTFTPEQLAQIEAIVLGEVVKVDASMSVEVVNEEAPA